MAILIVQLSRLFMEYDVSLFRPVIYLSVCYLTAFLFAIVNSVEASAKQAFPDTVAKIKPSILGVGTFLRTRQPARKLYGTGFVVADGNHVITNWHVIDQPSDTGLLSVFAGNERKTQIFSARIIGFDKRHDLALLRFDGPQMPAMKVVSSHQVREGEVYGFTGFPIGQVLGLYPVTHQGMIAAISPFILPKDKAGKLSASDLKKLQDPFEVFQLDGTAYPGNSGSPLYRIDNGQVVGVINKVLIKESKESVLSKPSGISFAIPSDYVLELLQKNRVQP